MSAKKTKAEVTEEAVEKPIKPKIKKTMAKTQKKTRLSILRELKLASVPLVWLSTDEEYRCFSHEKRELIKSGAATVVYRWSSTGRLLALPSGKDAKFDVATKAIQWFSRRNPSEVEASPVSGRPATDEYKTLGTDNDYAPNGSVLILYDVAFQLQKGNNGSGKHSNPILCRVIKDAFPDLFATRKMIVIVSHTNDIPPELEHSIVHIEHALPDTEEIEEMLERARGYIVDEENKDGVEIPEEERTQIVGALTGMREHEIDNTLSIALRNREIQIAKDPTLKRGFCIETIREQRIQAIKKNSTLQIIKPEGGLDLVAGLEEAKQYFRLRRKMFTPAYRNEGLSNPKGVVLGGLSGTGKTLLCGCIAHEWGATILRGDVGACKGSLVGQSEHAFKKMLKDAENQAAENSPVVLQLDEAGKMFGAGIRGNGSQLDSGVSSGMSAIFLTWRQECKKPVYVIMTCNEDMMNFPMEWLRRFDTSFFVDVPTHQGRIDAFRIHLQKRGWDTKDINLDQLAKQSEGWTPSEIEKAVENGILHKVESDGPRPAVVQTKHLLQALVGVKPMTESNATEVTALRRWAAERGYPGVLDQNDVKSPRAVEEEGSGRRRSVSKSRSLESDII